MADRLRYARTVLLATIAGSGAARCEAYAHPTSTPTTGPSATFWGRKPSAPTVAPVTAPTATGPAPVSRPAAQPIGAARAVLTAIRCQSAGISPGR